MIVKYQNIEQIYLIFSNSEAYIVSGKIYVIFKNVILISL